MSDKTEQAAEFSWFAPCCEEDFRYLGVPEPELASTPEHVRDVVLAADRAGFQNILLPSGFNTGVDSWLMATALACEVKNIRLLPAVRIGEQHVPMFARAASNLDHLLNGKLNVNIISSPMVGLPPQPSETRYRATQEFMHLVKAFWSEPRVEFSGDFYKFDLKSDLPPTVQKGGPPLYFGGSSPAARAAAAAEADVYLFWGDTIPAISEGLTQMRALASEQGRELIYGLRIHVIARETEEEAKAAADLLVSRLTADAGETIRQRSLDKDSAGKARQNELLSMGDWVDTYLWTGVGRGRGGCGTAIVGSYDQVESKLRDYMALGIEAFILSGYPHLEEAERFGKYLLPRFAQTTGPELLSRLHQKA